MDWLSSSVDYHGFSPNNPGQALQKIWGKLKIYTTFIETIHQWKTTKKQTKNLVIYMQKRAKTFKFISWRKKNGMTHERDYPLLDKLPFYILLDLLTFLKFIIGFWDKVNFLHVTTLAVVDLALLTRLISNSQKSACHFLLTLYFFINCTFTALRILKSTWK